MAENKRNRTREAKSIARESPLACSMRCFDGEKFDACWPAYFVTVGGEKARYMRIASQAASMPRVMASVRPVPRAPERRRSGITMRIIPAEIVIIIIEKCVCRK